VEVLIPVATSPDVDDPTGWKAAEAPADMAEQHDHYLYGQPKV
jgi:hypothetical protein